VDAERRFLVYDRGGWLGAALADRDLQLRKKPNDFLEVRTRPQQGAPVRAANLARGAE